ncbi:MAG: phasin family protein [Xanthobacteraceae bacterium]
MAEENEDEKQFFKDLGATAEQTLEEVRGFEVNYFNVIGRMVATLPWLADFNKKMQSYFEQDFAAALEFAHELRQAKDVQDFIRIQFEYSQKCFQSLAAQMRDFAETYANVASGAIKAPSLYSLE